MITRHLLFFLVTFAPSLVAAQSLEPRLYLPLPTGLNVVSLSYGSTSGTIVFDAMMPVTDSHASLHTGTVAYVRTFGLFGRSSQFQAVAPFASGEASAVVAGRDTTRNLDGPADPMLRLAVNLAGGPARRRQELAGVKFGIIVGASLSLSMPFGHYDNDRRVNVGANRWSIKPELGVVQPLGTLALEGYAGVWLFGDNTDYLNGSTVSQEPLWTLQGHFIRVVGRRGWLALDGTLVRGGATSLDGVVQNTLEENVRLGATAAWFINNRHAFKAAFATGVTTRYGGDFDIFTIGYQYAWGG